MKLTLYGMQKAKYSYDYKGASQIKGITTTRANHDVTVLLLIRASGVKY